ncbi:MAG TPA: hypothetical protein VL614_00435 [Acetobacteraceae bacterium]|jgi:hypothetical protein|nr:hypothetical protein [Acetobacteraceae bacterium]
MNADGVIRALTTQGEIVTVKRLTGTRQVAFSVDCLAFVEIGVESVLVGSVQQTADKITLTDREMNEKQWPKPPRQGDQIVFSDGTTRTMQGRADVRRVAEDLVYFIKTLGG